MITYSCEATIGDVSIWCMGAEVATLDDLDCTLELDGDGDLIAVELPVDHVTGRTVRVTADVTANGAYADPNAHSIWCAALASVSRSRDEIIERACIPAPPYERPEYTGPEYIPTGHGLIGA